MSEFPLPFIPLSAVPLGPELLAVDDLPVSTAQQDALDLKQDADTAATDDDLAAAFAAALIRPSVKVSKSAVQSISNNLLQAVNFDTEIWDNDNLHYTSIAALTGTVAKTNGSNALVGTGTAFTTELSVGQAIDVPGTAVATRVVTAITDDTHLTVAGNYANTASGQTATRRNSVLVCRTPGIYICTFYGSLPFNAAGSYRMFVLGQYPASGPAVRTIVGDDHVSQITDMAATVSAQVKLAQWDMMQAEVYQNVGSALDLNAGATFAMTMLST